MPSLLQALSHPGMAPRLQVISIMSFREVDHELPTAIRRKGWPELKVIEIMGNHSASMMADVMGAIKEAVPKLEAFTAAFEDRGQDGDRFMRIFDGLLGGACPRLQVLMLGSCGGDDLGDAEVAELARVLEGGAPCNHTLKKLELYSPGLGSRGMQALAAAFTRGACPNLMGLVVSGGPAVEEGVPDLIRARGSGALPNLTVLDVKQRA